MHLTVDLKKLGVIGDGNSHPLSERFTTIEEAKIIYPNAISLTDEIDWCAMQYALINYNKVYVKDLSLVINRTMQMIENGELILSNNSKILISADVDGIVTQRNIKLTGGNIYVKIPNYTHSCLLVDGSALYYGYNTLIKEINFFGYNYFTVNPPLEGTAIKLQALNDGDNIMNVAFDNIRIWSFDCDINLVVDKGEGKFNWITGCSFSNMFCDWARTFIKLEGTSQVPHQCTGNLFSNVQLNCKTFYPEHPEYSATIEGIYCEGGENTFSNCFLWDFGNDGASNVLYRFASGSEYNIVNTPVLYKEQIIDNGEGNIFSTLFFNTQIEKAINSVAYSANSTLSTMLGVQDNVLAFVDLLGGKVVCSGDQPYSLEFPITNAFRNHVNRTFAKWFNIDVGTTISITPHEKINSASVMVINFESGLRPKSIRVRVYDTYLLTWVEMYTSNNITEDKIVIQMYYTDTNKIEITMLGMQRYAVSIASISVSAACSIGTSFLPRNGGKIVGDLEVAKGKNLIIYSPNGKQFRIIVNNKGILTAVPNVPI